ncbi:hypothetical protein SB776_33585, partial [Burkholderia sp. SIMBA_045]
MVDLLDMRSLRVASLGSSTTNPRYRYFATDACPHATRTDGRRCVARYLSMTRSDSGLLQQ